MNVKISAPAKINLYLDILWKRKDGFHNIQSIMQTVSLSDTVSIRTESEGGIRITCSNPIIPQDERNIAWKAANEYINAFDVDCKGLSIYIEKNIPVCAGLAGGSTDAAAVLLGLNSIYEKASVIELIDCAAKLGSDVPFCLVKGTKITQQKGEDMTSVPPMPDCTILICSSGESVSTAWAYGELDRIHNDFSDRREMRSNIRGMIDGLRGGSLNEVTSNMYNIFEEAVFPLCPKAKETKEKLLALGADNAMMSGSGSAVFGIFTDKEAALKARSALENSERKVFLCRPQ